MAPFIGFMILFGVHPLAAITPSVIDTKVLMRRESSAQDLRMQSNDNDAPAIYTDSARLSSVDNLRNINALTGKNALPPRRLLNESSDKDDTDGLLCACDTNSISDEVGHADESSLSLMESPASEHNLSAAMSDLDKVAFWLNFQAAGYWVRRGPNLVAEAGTIENKSGRPHVLRLTNVEKPLLAPSIGQFGTADFTIVIDAWSTGQGSKAFFHNGPIRIYSDYLSVQDGGDRNVTFTYPSGRWATYACTRQGIDYKMFIDGAEVANMSLSSNFNADYTGEGSTGEVRLNDNWEGWLDNIAIWHGVALTAQQQDSLDMDATTAPTQEPTPYPTHNHSFLRDYGCCRRRNVVGPPDNFRADSLPDA